MAIISTFRERPAMRSTWWAMGLGCVVLFSGPILGLSAALLVPALGSLLSDTAAAVIGSGVALLVLAAGITAFVLSIRAYRRGERSWAMWVGLVPASLAMLFWAFMIVGEFLFPH